MLWKKNDPDRDRQLDRLGLALIRASRASEEEIETAVSSPALLERIRARAQGSERRPPGAINDWASAILTAPQVVAWRAIPALSLLAAVALALWLGAEGGPPETPFDNAGTAVEIIESQPLAPATACSVATKEQCAVSTDDAVAILVSATAREANR
jgi:hypothetical protein